MGPTAPSAGTAIPRLVSVATAVPPYELTQRDVLQQSRQVFAAAFRDFERLAPVYGNAEIDRRSSCVPLTWYGETHDFKDRNALFVSNAVELLEAAAERALTAAGLTAADVDAVVAVSTSGIATPSLDALIVERMALRRDVQRLPVFGLGCAGGVIGLARAGQIAMSCPGMRVLFLVVELCGLTFRNTDRTKSNVIATALFGDGAAAAVLTAAPEVGDGYGLRAWGEHTWPDTLDVMGWHIENDGFGVLFSHDIPTIVRREFRVALDAFLATNNLALDDIDGFAIHPGGAKVVAAVEEAIGQQRGSLVESRLVLREFGNMSAVTVMFVLERIVARKNPPQRILMASLGPGFTVGFAVLDRL